MGRLRIRTNPVQLGGAKAGTELGNKSKSKSQVLRRFQSQFGGGASAPKLKWDRPKTYKFLQSPHFQNPSLVVIVPVLDVFITIGYLRFTKVSLAKLTNLTLQNKKYPTVTITTKTGTTLTDYGF